MQVVILVVDQQQRPDLPQDLMALPGRPLGSPGPYLDLMQQCWATDPAQRPSFERVISALRCLSRPYGSCAVKQSAKAGTHIAVHEKLASFHLPVQSLHTSLNLFPVGQICNDLHVGVRCAVLFRNIIEAETHPANAPGRPGQQQGSAV